MRLLKKTTQLTSLPPSWIPSLLTSQLRWWVVQVVTMMKMHWHLVPLDLCKGFLVFFSCYTSHNVFWVLIIPQIHVTLHWVTTHKSNPKYYAGHLVTAHKNYMTPNLRVSHRITPEEDPEVHRDKHNKFWGWLVLGPKCVYAAKFSPGEADADSGSNGPSDIDPGLLTILWTDASATSGCSGCSAWGHLATLLGIYWFQMVRFIACHSVPCLVAAGQVLASPFKA